MTNLHTFLSPASSDWDGQREETSLCGWTDVKWNVLNIKTLQEALWKSQLTLRIVSVVLRAERWKSDGECGRTCCSLSDDQYISRDSAHEWSSMWSECRGCVQGHRTGNGLLAYRSSLNLLPVCVTHECGNEIHAELLINIKALIETWRTSGLSCKTCKKWTEFGWRSCCQWTHT